MAYSVAEARQNFARLIRSERGKVIEITWRGEPGAVLLSAGEYLAHTGERPRFIETLTRYEPRFQRQGVPGRPSHRSYGSPTRPPGEV
jgi:prevent-host-death family protein